MSRASSSCLNAGLPAGLAPRTHPTSPPKPIPNPQILTVAAGAGAATGAGGGGGGQGLMARLRRWNIINKSEDCEPDENGAAGGAGGGMGGHEVGAGKGGAGTATRALQIKALKVRPKCRGFGGLCVVKCQSLWVGFGRRAPFFFVLLLPQT